MCMLRPEGDTYFPPIDPQALARGQRASSTRAGPDDERQISRVADLCAQGAGKPLHGHIMRMCDKKRGMRARCNAGLPPL